MQQFLTEQQLHQNKNSILRTSKMITYTRKQKSRNCNNDETVKCNKSFYPFLKTFEGRFNYVSSSLSLHISLWKLRVQRTVEVLLAQYGNHFYFLRPNPMSANELFPRIVVVTWFTRSNIVIIARSCAITKMKPVHNIFRYFATFFASGNIKIICVAFIVCCPPRTVMSMVESFKIQWHEVSFFAHVP